MGKQQAPDTTSGWLEQIRGQFSREPRFLIPVLQFVQSKAGYLPPEAMSAAAKHLGVSESKVFGVASFYSLFKFEPRGANTVTVCRGTACHVRGSAVVLRDIENKLGVKAGQTTGDMSFSLETVACFGSCALAPVAVVNAKVFGRQTSATLARIVDGIGTSKPGKQGKGKPGGGKGSAKAKAKAKAGGRKAAARSAGPARGVDAI